MDQILEGTRLRMTGSGIPLVLLHGVGMRLEMWEKLAARLERDFRVIRYDLLGHGSTTRPAAPYDLGMFTGQLEAVMRNAEAARATLVGFSLGALIAEGFAIEHKHAVDKLILINGVYDRSAEERAAVLARVDQVRRGGMAGSVEQAIERWFTPAFQARCPTEVEAVRRDVLANDIPCYLASYEVFATADAELAHRVDEIRCPTLVITGSEDRRSTPHMANRLAGRLPAGRALLIEHQRHMTPIEVPEILAAHIRNFVAEA